MHAVVVMLGIRLSLGEGMRSRRKNGASSIPSDDVPVVHDRLHVWGVLLDVLDQVPTQGAPFLIAVQEGPKFRKVFRTMSPR